MFGICVWCGCNIWAVTASGRWFLAAKEPGESASKCRGDQTPDGKHDPGASIQNH